MCARGPVWLRVADVVRVLASALVSDLVCEDVRVVLAELVRLLVALVVWVVLGVRTPRCCTCRRLADVFLTKSAHELRGYTKNRHVSPIPLNHARIYPWPCPSTAS